MNAKPTVNRTRARRRALKPYAYFLKLLRPEQPNKRSEADIRRDLVQQLEQTYMRHELRRIADELTLAAADNDTAQHKAA